MQIITINLPEPLVSLIDKLVELKLHPNRNAAIRFIIQDAIDKHMKIISLIADIDQGKDRENNIIVTEDYEEQPSTVNFRVPATLHTLMKADMQKRGIKNKSEYIRQAILTYIMRSVLER